MDPDPAKDRSTFKGRRGPWEGRRWDCPAPGPGGRWSRGSRVHCPREGAMFFLPGTPRWRPGARGLSRRKTHDPKSKAELRQGGRAPDRVVQSPGPRPPRRSRQRRGEGRVPRATVPVPGRLERLRETLPNHGLGRRRAGRNNLLSGRAAVRQRSSEKQARDPRPLRPRPP